MEWIDSLVNAARRDIASPGAACVIEQDKGWHYTTWQRYGIPDSRSTWEEIPVVLHALNGALQSDESRSESSQAPKAIASPPEYSSTVHNENPHAMVLSARGKCHCPWDSCATWHPTYPLHCCRMLLPKRAAPQLLRTRRTSCVLPSSFWSQR